MGKHTPGPWELSGDGLTIRASEVDPGPNEDGVFRPRFDIARLVCDIPANARLIAAAPALAEALALVEGMLDNFPGFESCAYPLTDGPSANIGEIVRAALRAAGVIE